MEVASKPRYGPCPKCSAMNMSHRPTCYRCRSTLIACDPQKTSPPRALARGHFGPCRGPNMRRYDREETRIPEVLIEGEVAFRHRATVLDVSLFGMRIRSSTPIRIGAQIRLNLPVEGRSMPVEGTVKHRSAMPDTARPVYVYGIKLNESSPTIRRILSHL